MAKEKEKEKQEKPKVEHQDEASGKSLKVMGIIKEPKTKFMAKE